MCIYIYSPFASFLLQQRKQTHFQNFHWNASLTCQRGETNPYVWTSHFHFDLAICCPSTESRHKINWILALVVLWSCLPATCSLASLCTTTVPVSQQSSGSSRFQLLLLVFLAWPRPGWMPISGQDTRLLSQWHAHTHQVSRASSQFKHDIQKLAPNVWIRTSVPSILKELQALFHTILRQTRHPCLIPYERSARSPHQPASLI